MRTRSHSPLARLLTIAGALIIAACSPDAGPIAPKVDAPALKGGVTASIGLASPAWQTLITTAAGQALFNPLVSARAYPLLGVAQYRAVQRAEAAIGYEPGDNLPTSRNGVGAGGRARLETDRGAVAGASAVVMAYLFPTRVAEFEALVDAQANAGPGGVHPAFTAAEEIGRAVGVEIVVRARADGFGAPATYVPLLGPGYWVSATTPPSWAGSQMATTTPWFLTSASQFRPAPPPTFGTPAFMAAVAEIRQLSDTRTPAQAQIAAFWALNPGTPTAPGFWMIEATNAIAPTRMTEREATHLYALLGAAMFDAQIGCWDAKQTYWTLRPWQADPGIVTLASVGRPNHPSYPSGHSCTSAAGASVLAAFFPGDAARLSAMVIEAGLSRMYGGIHYRFDVEAGRILGQQVAAFAIASDAAGTSVLTDR